MVLLSWNMMMTFGNYDDYVRTSVLYYGINKWIVQTECI